MEVSINNMGIWKGWWNISAVGRLLLQNIRMGVLPSFNWRPGGGRWFLSRGNVRNLGVSVEEKQSVT